MRGGAAVRCARWIRRSRLAGWAWLLGWPALHPVPAAPLEVVSAPGPWREGAARDTVVVLEEGFTALGLPEGWSREQLPASPGWQTGSQAEAASPFFPVPAHGRFAYCNSDAAGPGVEMDDRLLTPWLTLPPSLATRLEFQAYHIVWGNTADLQLRLEDGEWQSLLTLGDGDDWTRWEAQLDAWAGQTVQLAFHYSNHGQLAFGVALDDVALRSISDDVDPPAIQPEPRQHFLTQWLPLPLEARLTDASGLGWAQAVGLAPDGALRSCPLDEVEEGLYRGGLDVRGEAGSWRWWVEAQDGANPPNLARSDTLATEVGVPAWLKVDDGHCEVGLGQWQSPVQAAVCYHPGLFPLRVDSLSFLLAQFSPAHLSLVGLGPEGGPDEEALLWGPQLVQGQLWSPVQVAVPESLIVLGDFAVLLSLESGYAGMDVTGHPWPRDSWMRSGEAAWSPVEELGHPGNFHLRAHVSSDRPRHFLPVEGSTSWSLYQVDSLRLNGHPLQEGDELGIFDGALCVGACRLSGTAPLQLLAFAASEGSPGYQPGHAPLFRFWSALHGLELEAEVATGQGPELFSPGDTSRVGLWTWYQHPPAAFGLFEPDPPCLSQGGPQLELSWEASRDDDPWEQLAYQVVWAHEGDTLRAWTAETRLELDLQEWLPLHAGWSATGRVEAHSLFPDTLQLSEGQWRLEACPPDSVLQPFHLLEPAEGHLLTDWQPLQFGWTAANLQGWPPVHYHWQLEWEEGRRSLASSDTLLLVSLDSLGLPRDTRTFRWQVRAFNELSGDSLDSPFRQFQFDASPVLGSPGPRPVQLRARPNPFNPSTWLEVDLPRPARVRLNLYNLRGQRLEQWDLGRLGSGLHRWPWGAAAASGLYVAELWVDEQVVARLKLVRVQ